MADILDLIQQDQTTAENVGLAGARADNNWAQTFNSIPPVEKLRATRNLTDQVNAAVERRAALAAQTDLKAQQIYYNAKKLEQDMAGEKKRMTLLDSQINHENALTDATGASTLFQREKETALNNSVAALASTLLDLRKRGVKSWQDEHKQAVLQAVHDEPGILKAYPTLIKDLADESLQAQQVREAIENTPGLQITGATTGKNPSIRYGTEKPPKGEVFESLNEARAKYGPNTVGHPLPDGGVYVSRVAGEPVARQAPVMDRKRQMDAAHNIAFEYGYKEGVQEALNDPKAKAKMGSQYNEMWNLWKGEQPQTKTEIPAAAAQVDITPDAHSALKAGETFWWKGKQLTKQ